MMKMKIQDFHFTQNSLRSSSVNVSFVVVEINFHFYLYLFINMNPECCQSRGQSKFRKTLRVIMNYDLWHFDVLIFQEFDFNNESYERQASFRMINNAIWVRVKNYFVSFCFYLLKLTSFEYRWRCLFSRCSTLSPCPSRRRMRNTRHVGAGALIRISSQRKEFFHILPCCVFPRVDFFSSF